MTQYDKIRTLLFKYSYLGVEKGELLGSTFIGKSPRVHPWDSLWLNIIFPTIGLHEIEIIENEVGRKIPRDFSQFLMGFSNGLDMMDSLYLLGYRQNYIRKGNWTLEQPYDIITANTYERPRNSTVGMFYIGGYISDGSKLYMTPDGMVHLCRSEDSTTLLTWPSLPEMLISEIERIYALYDERGIQIDDTVPTTPLNLEDS